ncbi:MAG: thiolase family protein [Deltaproteobacteria bacterium]|nr:thiolase family protein [Deltaproteobacteria bacterium]
MSKDKDVVIVAAARTAIGTFGGSLKDVKAHKLAAHVMREVLRRADNLDADLISDIIVGDCLQAFDQANTARTAALAAGIPVSIPAFTVQRNCASSMQALISGKQQILTQDGEIVLVAGVESMSTGPYYMDKARWGMRLMNQEVTDSVWEALHSGSRVLGQPMIMGLTAENLAEMDDISREEQDKLALESHHKAEAAIKEGRFKDEIVAIEVDKGKGESLFFDQDEHPRFGLKLEDLAKLRPVFKENGTVTAGNSSGINDGAAAAIIMTRKRAKELGLKPLAHILTHGIGAVEPKVMGIGPVPATEKALRKAGMSLKDMQLIELNEAFAAQYLSCERRLGLDRTITNVNGSGVSLGHPVGCTGLRILVTLVYEMIRRDLEVGLATLCVGGGMGMATIVTRD